ncbi:putative RNA-directed DNA polymerase from transposon X-element [Trichonephila clavipes]|nr:putative RNA-directed DNA polymerase from transposon X-element [Trichonephila clavipes]
MMMIRHNLIGLNLCSWNANGILNKNMEFKIFVEKYCPDLILMQETHLRSKHNINIPNYICYRNDRNTDENAYGGTLILIRRNIPHYNLPTPPTPAHGGYDRSSHPPPNFNPISIISVYIPPRSDDRLFTHDLEQLLQTNSNCDFWRSKCLTQRVELLSQFLARTSNTLDIAVINNFNFPFTIDSIPELSSDHNPVFLNFSLTTPIHSDNSRAVTTCWSEFRNNLKKSVRLSDFSGIRNPNVLEEKIYLLTAAVCSAHHQASKPIENRKHSFTPNDIHDLIYLKNKAKRERDYIITL